MKYEDIKFKINDNFKLNKFEKPGNVIIKMNYRCTTTLRCTKIAVMVECALCNVSLCVCV